MIHTYRDPKVLGSRFFSPSYLSFCGLVLIFPFVPMLAFGAPFTRGDAVLVAVCTGMVFVYGYFAYRHEHYRSCGEIRLGDDGTCELETKRRVIRLHVNEIRSVQYSPETGEEDESYTIHYAGGRLDVATRMTGFPDFLSRLRTLNPTVDLTSFPADAWPDLGIPAAEERGTFVSPFIRSALFPLIVIALLVYLASETLVGK